MANEEKKYTEQVSVRWYGYIVLILTILFSQESFLPLKGPSKALDFTNISGSFGSLGEITEDAGTLASDFRGTGGSGARDAWLFALTLVPAVMLALGVVKVVEHLDGLRAAQKLLTPLLMPLLGIPGICGLTLIASLQSTERGASMTAELFQDGMIAEKQKTIFASFPVFGRRDTDQLPVLLRGAVPIPVRADHYPPGGVFVFKFFGANLTRIYLYKFCKEEI